MNFPLLKDLIVSDKWDVDFNFSNPGEHIPGIERGNITLEERFRVQFYGLPFEALRRVMIRYLPVGIGRKKEIMKAAFYICTCAIRMRLRNI